MTEGNNIKPIASLIVERRVPCAIAIKSPNGYYVVKTTSESEFDREVKLDVETAVKLAHFILQTEEKFSPNQNV